VEKLLKDESNKMLKKSPIIILIFLISIFTSLAYTPDWQIDIITEIELDSSTITSQYIAGAGDPADDDSDANDIPLPPPAPGANIITYSITDSNDYLGEYKESLEVNDPKTWEIIQEGSREFKREDGLTQTMTWILTNVPNSLEIKLIDYGEDENRNNIVQEINLTSETSYSFNIDRPYNEYRYLIIEATLTEETCFEDWDCPDWEDIDCPESGIKTRTCTDLNDCGTTISRPDLATSCTYICNEDWDCPDWEDIDCPSSGIKVRTCTDDNNCGTTNQRPPITTTCTYICNEYWDCPDWDSIPCPESEIKTRTCTDLNDCGTTNDKPSESQSCSAACIEDWDCPLWSSIPCPASEIKTRTCTDKNACGTTDDKPSESQSCTYQQQTCSENSCSQTYQDYCSNNKLVEYNANKQKDSALIQDSCQNSYINNQCTDCTASCPAPPTQSYCVKDICNAECETNADCDDNNQLTTDTCQSCTCQHEVLECTTNSDCDDDSLCTNDQCNSETNTCQYSYNTNPCDDSLYCTTNDKCTGGTCIGQQRDCSSNDKNIGTCKYNPDNKDSTYDSYGFTSICDEEHNTCTLAPSDWKDDIRHTKDSRCEDDNDDNDCDPLWGCTQWSECNDGIRTRTCKDKNKCGKTKPKESISCEETKTNTEKKTESKTKLTKTSTPKEPKTQKKISAQPITVSYQKPNTLIGIIIILVIIIVGLSTYYIITK